MLVGGKDIQSNTHSQTQRKERHTRQTTFNFLFTKYTVVFKKECRNMSQQLELYTYCPINMHYIEGYYKKKAYLMRVDNIAMCLYCSLLGSETMSRLVKTIREKRLKMFFWGKCSNVTKPLHTSKMRRHKVKCTYKPIKITFVFVHSLTTLTYGVR